MKKADNKVHIAAGKENRPTFKNILSIQTQPLRNILQTPQLLRPFTLSQELAPNFLGSMLPPKATWY